MLFPYMASLSESIYPGSSARIHGLMGLDTRDNGHRYAGRDKEKTIFTKDSKEYEMRSEA